MKILMVAEVLHPETVGGAGRVAAELAKGLAARGHDVRVLARGAPAAAPESPRDGYRIFRFAARTDSPLGAWRSTSAGVREAVGRATVSWRPDIVHSHQPLAGWFARRALPGVPFVHTFYAPWPAEYLVKRRGDAPRAALADRAIAAGMAALEGDVLRAADAVVCLSRFSAGQINNRYPGVEPRLVAGGVDLERFRPPRGPERAAARRRWDLPSAAFVALSVRNLVPRMGLEAFLEAAAEARPAVPDLVVALAGDGPLRPALEARARGADLAGAVRLLGHVDEADLPDLYRAADLFVLPTRALEGFGLVALEAYATGLPVLGTNVGAIPEIVSLDGDPDLLVEPRPARIAAGLVRAARRRAALGAPEAAARRRRIAEGFAWDRMVEAYEEIYRPLR